MKIAIIGNSCTGKTTLSESLALLYPDHTVIHTDNYRPHGFVASVDAMIDDIERLKSNNFICEGTQAVLLMRKAAEMRRLFFDVVIECTTNEQVQMNRYCSERDASRWPYIPIQNKGLATMLIEYKQVVNTLGRSPVFLTHAT